MENHCPPWEYPDFSSFVSTESSLLIDSSNYLNENSNLSANSLFDYNSDHNR